MNLSTHKTLQKTTQIFFVFSLLIIAFGVFDVILQWYEVVEITLSYSIIWLAVLVVSLLLLGISGKWKKFSLILFLGIGNFLLFIYVAFSFPISVTKSVKNSQYLLEVNANGKYEILEKNCCFKRKIAEKASGIFFTPYSKTGIVPVFEARLISETTEMMVLEIETSGYQSFRKVQDTIQKLKN